VDEFDLIETVFAPLAAEGAPAFALGDDAAVMRPPQGREIVLTTDMMVAGRHFLNEDAPDLIARKLLRVNLSDLAAMGAEPEGYLLGLAFADRLDVHFARRFAAGLATDQQAFGLSLLGGDTVSGAGRLTLSLTAIGSVPSGEALQRSGADIGDDIYVSGHIGDAALALKGLRGELEGAAALAERYYLPAPRLALGIELRGVASACIDVSDGVVADLGHICRRSGVGARIEAAQLPMSGIAGRLLQDRPELWPVVLAGGDDYELLFAAPPDRQAAVSAAAQASGIAVHKIGAILGEVGVRVVDAAGERIEMGAGGFRHR